MARYTIDFTTNANRIIREIEAVNRKVAQVARTGKSVRITLDPAPLQAGLNATFRQLDKQIESMQRKLSKLQIGSGAFRSTAASLGFQEGQRERGQLIAEPSRLRGQAQSFDEASAVRLSKELQAARIEASQLAPNTGPWIDLQKQIGQINAQLKATDRLAESIQMQESLGAFAPGSLNDLEARLTVLRNRAREIAPDTAEWKQLNKEILNVERGIEKQTRRPLTGGERLGAAGGAFLYGGGLGGGIGSAVGGIAGGLAGGVPAAFTGAAIGQAVDNLSAMAFAMNEQANSIKRLRLGLASASIDLNDFAEANQLVADISDRLLIPIGEVYGQFTRLRASTVALGIDTKTTGEVFEGVSIAVLKTGGSMEDVNGAMRAVSQVFSKGKVTAEELRGQLGERLPGAVVKFAKENKIALQDLDKAFEGGQVSIDQFVTFAKGLLKESEGYSDALATNQEYASARYAKAVEKMQLAIGRAVGPMLNSIQDFAAEAINSILKLSGKLEEFAKYMENRFGGGTGDSTFLGEGSQNIADRIIGGDVEIKDLENRTRFFESKIKESQATLERIQSGRYEDQRNIFEMMFGGPGEENLRKNLPSQIKFYKKQLKELLDARKLAEGKTKGESALTPSSANPEADKRASAFLDAVERREQSIADARQGYEKEIASIREDAIKQAEALERRYQDQRLQDERELGRVRRDLAAAAQEENLLTRGISGEDPALLDQERKIGDAIRQYTEDKISREEQAQDRQIGLSRELEDFKRQNADAINKANERYANAIGKIQQEYAKSVAKIIEDGSGSGAKKLAAAGKIVASLLSQAAAQQTFQQVTGIPIRPAVNGVEAGGRVFQDKSGLAAAVLAGALQAGQDVQTINTAVTAAKNYFDAVAGSRNAQRELNKELAIAAKIQPTKMPSVDTGDIESSIQEKQQALTKSLGQINNEKDALSKQKNIYNELLGAIKDAGDEVNANKRQIDDQNSAIEDQLQLIRNGMLPALAEEELTRENIFDKWRKYAQQGADQILKATTNKEIQENVLTILQEQLNVIANQETAYAAAQSVLRDNAALLDAAKIEEQTRGVGRGLGAGFINEAGAAYEEQISKGVSPEAAASVARATEQLTIAKGAVDALQSSINGIGAAFGEAMTTGVASLISGTATAKEVFASFLQSVGQALSQAASQMIATYIAIGIAKLFAGLGGASSDMSKTGISESTLAPMRQYQMPVIPNANGNVLKGGFKAFANGGVVSGPTLGLVGEGKYNEAIVPLPDGRSIPVTMNGGQSSRNLLSNGAAKQGSSPVLSMSFQSTTINGVEYVDRAQLEAAMAETRRLAARDGASQGSQLALNKIKNSPTTRRQLGF